MSKSLHTLQVENMELSMELGEMQDELLRMQGVIWKCQELFEMIRENNGNAPHVFNCAESGLSVIERKGICDMDKQDFKTTKDVSDLQAGIGCLFIVVFILAILVVLMLFAMTLVAFA